MEKRMITFGLCVIISITTCSASASSHALCGHIAKRRKTNPEPELPHNQTATTNFRDKISAPILEVCTTLPVVMVDIIVGYLRSEQWREQYTYRAHQQAAHHIRFDGTSILSMFKNHLTTLTNEKRPITQIFEIPINFYTRTYLLYSQKNLYLIVNNNRKKSYVNKRIDIYRVPFRDHTKIKVIKSYAKAQYSQLSTTTLLGIILHKERTPIVFDCETEEEWQVPVHLNPRHLAFAENKLLAISGMSGIIELWNIPRKSFLGVIASQRKVDWQAISVTSEGIVATTTHSDISMHTIANPDYASCQANNLYHFEFSSNGAFIVGFNHSNNCVEIRNSTTGSLLEKLISKQNTLGFTSGCAVAPDNRRIVISYINGSLSVWEPQQTDDYDITT